MTENEIVKVNNAEIAINSETLSGITAFKEAVLMISEVTGKSVTFIAETIMKGKRMGLNPFTAYDAFWDIEGKASEKTSAIMGFLVSQSHKTGGKILPFVKLEDAAYVYYYFDGNSEQLKEAYSKYDEYVLKAAKQPIDPKKPVLTLEQFLTKLLKTNLRDEELVGGIKTNIRVIIQVPIGDNKTKSVYERRTTLQGKRIYPDGTIDVRNQSYRLSTAISLSLYFDKNGNIKKNWNDLSKMMLKRCMKDLCNELAPDIMYPFENEFDNTSEIDSRESAKDIGEVTIITEPKK